MRQQQVNVTFEKSALQDFFPFYDLCLDICYTFLTLRSLNIIQDIPKNLSGCLLPAFPCKAYNMSLNVNISVYSEPHNNDSQIYKFLVKIPALADL